MESSAAPAVGGAPKLKLSTTVLFGIAAIGGILLASVFAYILVVAQMGFSARLWWMGFAGGIFAIAFYILQGVTGDRTILRPLAAAFFLIGAGGFYGAILTNTDSDSLKLIWIVILSILVVGVLAAMFYMSRDAERDAARKAQRKVTP